MDKSMTNDEIVSYVQNNKNLIGSLPPNHGLVHWLSFCAAKRDLSSFSPNNRPSVLTYEEVAKHNKQDDCWMVLHRKVYNITPYMNYHPGGVPFLMLMAGKDATDVFMKVHSWVSIERILPKCFIAPVDQLSRHGSQKITTKKNTLVPPGNVIFDQNNSLIIPAPRRSSTLSVSTTNLKSASFSLQSPLNIIENYDALITNAGPRIFLFTGIEKSRRKHTMSFMKDTLAISIKCVRYLVKVQKGFVARFDGKSLRFLTYFTDYRYMLHFGFSRELKDYCKVRWLNMDIGSLEVDLFYLNTTEEPLLKTTSQDTSDTSNRSAVVTSTANGTLPLTCEPLLNNDRTYKADDYTIHMQYYECTLLEKRQLTPDVYLFVFGLPSHLSMKCPIGYHNFIKLSSRGDADSKPYTPVPSYLVLPRGSIYSPKSDIVPNYNNTLNFIIKIYPLGQFTPLLHKIKIGRIVWISEFVGTFDESCLFSTSTSPYLGNNNNDSSNFGELPSSQWKSSPSNSSLSQDEAERAKPLKDRSLYKNRNTKIPSISFDLTTDSTPTQTCALSQTLLLISAGTGITPILSILHRLYNDDLYMSSLELKDMKAGGKGKSLFNRRQSSIFNFSKCDITRIVLVNCNRSLADIIWKDELEKLAQKWPHRFITMNVLSRQTLNPQSIESSPPCFLENITGHFSSKIIWDHVLPRFLGDIQMDDVSKDNIDKDLNRLSTNENFPPFKIDPEKLTSIYCCVCGSTSFNATAFGVLEQVGIEDKRIHIFSG